MSGSLVAARPFRRASTLAIGFVLILGSASGCAKSDSNSIGGSGAIKVGVPLADTASLQKAGAGLPGALTVDDLKLMYSTALKSVSGTAAAGGRKLVPAFDSFDLVQPGAPQKACLKLTQDDKVDVVLAQQFVNGGDQCVVQRGGFLLQNVAAPQAAYSMSSGKVYTLDQVPNAAAKNFAAYLTTKAGLEGKKVGVLTDALGGDSVPVKKILLPALKQANINVVHVTTLTADLTQVAQQVPVEVAAMKDAGVQILIDATPSANLAQFLGGMAKVGWNAPFIASDLNNAVDTTFGILYPPTLSATAVTARRFGDVSGAEAGTCYSNYRKAGGKDLAPSTTGYQTLQQICDSVRVLAAGLEKLGHKSFTKDSFASALNKVGSLTLAYYGPSALSSATPSTVRGIRPVTWANKTWKPTGAWTEVSGG